MALRPPKIIFGALGAMGFTSRFSEADGHAWLNLLEKHNVKDLDTAHIYGKSEEIIGKLGAPKRFIIHSKAPGFSPGIMTKEKVLAGMEQTLRLLGVDSVETYYLHAPDPKTPIEETLSAIDELYKAGKFKHFGLSNYLAADVEKIYNIQSSRNAVLPTVYQGNYNAVSRHIENDLFPLLRKLKISFYAYSPSAGGFLVKSAQALRAGSDTGRFATNGPSGSLYNAMYGKETLLDALDEWELIAKDAGCSKAALAYRWVTWNSKLSASNGDGVILGASKISQLDETLTAIEDGPLDEKTAARIENIWKMVERDAPLDNYNSYMANL